MSSVLILKPSCGSCGSTENLYGSACKHLTLCLKCAKSMAEKRSNCYECGALISPFIREYNVRTCSSNEKKYFIGKFNCGLPDFKKNENKWTFQKEVLQGRQVTDTLREKCKNKPCLLEDGTGKFQYQGQLEGSKSATYYLLTPQGNDFVIIPAGSWYNFNKVPQYKQLTLEEAEEKMKGRRKTADGYQRWMMKAANNGASAFGAEVQKFYDREGAAGAGRGRKKTTGEDDERNDSDRGDEDEKEEAARKSRLGLNKKAGDNDDEVIRRGDFDFDDDDDDIEKGDDWEHEEIFTDDDEAVGNDFEEREVLAPEIPAPPEIKQEEEDEDEWDEEEGGLSKSGKELQKLLGRSNGLNDSYANDDDDMEEDMSPVVAPKKKAPKEEPVYNISPLKSTTSAAGRGTPSTKKSSKAKRKGSDEESKSMNSAPMKKLKTENNIKSVKDETAPSSKISAPTKGSRPSESGPAMWPSPVTEDELRAFLLEKGPVMTQDLVAKFGCRLKCKEDKGAFSGVLRKMSKIQKTNGATYVVLKHTPPSTKLTH